MMQGVVADRLVSLDCFARWTCSAVEVAIADDARRSQFFTALETEHKTHCHR
ncbi:hypothetical protein [Laspinema olomoucense]|uniref:hypothetical protein n=1 Tax=Laspinema olomoucense TaxID=3231600 RepID=UPI0021BAB3F7|nr:hypothetical protein [Laspinema sp. D3d]MCT7973328.1 hypothetical protein [Laspinema sp. D3d]